MPVEFEGDQHQRSILYAQLLQPGEQPPGIVNWMVTKGIARDAQRANRILVSVIVISFVVMGVIYYRSSPRSSSADDAEALRYLEESARNLPPLHR